MFEKSSVTIKALPVIQPIGEFFIGVIDAQDLLEISYADIRRIERDLDDYLGIQRKLSPSRTKELYNYVNTKDATFPSSIILAVSEENIDWDSEKALLTLKSTESIDFNHIAKVLDGQHRLEGLKGLVDKKPGSFEINVTIFVGADIADQANVFATVNLAQTKVNKSLVYDLLDYAKSRSPQKTAHEIALALDRTEKGPFEKRIKRLGTNTPGRANETLNQATLVNCLLELISGQPMSDRDTLMRGKALKNVGPIDLKIYPFRNLFINEKDIDIARILNNYFIAVRERWPSAWEDRSKGNILLRTNGFRALMGFLKNLYLDICSDDQIGRVVETKEFLERLKLIPLNDEDFNTTRYLPGTSGEAALYKDLIASIHSKNDNKLF